jgi:predicted kinase
MLIAFAGLPGTGKTTLARAIAEERRATYLRVDTIEQILRDSGVLAGDVGPAGYMVAYALASANLRLGQDVVADTVNPLAITRDGWRNAARAAGVAIVEVEVICSDAAEHRRRVETRTVDVPGLVPPRWEAVVARDYEAWDRPRVVIDTAQRSVADALAELRVRLTAL